MKQEISTNTTLYDMNKNLVKDEKTLSKKGVKNRLSQCLTPFLIKQSKNNQKYFMLLCRERYDFTLFNFPQKPDSKEIIESSSCIQDMFECLINRGKVISIETTDKNDALEIWINIDEEAFVYYFFPYDLGVIEVEVKE